MFVIRQAEKKDLFQIRKLIKEVGLRDRGIEQHLQHFFIAEVPAENKGEVSPMVGVVGMEVYPPYGLIRSFVLERAPWNSKVGINMIQVLLSYAEKWDYPIYTYWPDNQPVFLPSSALSKPDRRTFRNSFINRNTLSNPCLRDNRWFIPSGNSLCLIENRFRFIS